MNRILVFNDDEGLRILYAQELAEEGYDVFAASDAPGLMELTEKERPDLIVMDARSGKNEVPLLLGRIRDMYPSLVIILCTPYSHPKCDPDLILAAHHVMERPCLREVKLRIKSALALSGRFLAGIGHDKDERPAIHCQQGLWEPIG